MADRKTGNKKTVIVIFLFVFFFSIPALVFAGDTKAGEGETSQAKSPDDTWKIDLDKGIEIALKNNLSLQRAMSKVREARARLREARSANNPKLTVDGTYTRLTPIAEFSLPVPTPTGMTSRTIRLGQEDNTAYRGGLTMLLTSFGKTEHATAAAAIMVDRAMEDYHREEAQVVYQVKESYFSILKAMGFVTIAQENLDFAKVRFESGISASLELNDAMKSAVSAETSRLVAYYDYWISVAKIERAAGISWEGVSK